jgi:hypothetical protein
MKPHFVIAGALVMAAVMGFAGPAMAQITMLSGECEEISHTAEGPLGTDLTKRQSRFYCDSAVLTGSGNHILVQFTDKGSNRPATGSILGFAGGPLRNDTAGAGVMMDVPRVYLAANGKATSTDAGWCKLFLNSNSDLTELYCGVKIDYPNGRRLVASIAFKVRQ